MIVFPHTLACLAARPGGSFSVATELIAETDLEVFC